MSNISFSDEEEFSSLEDGQEENEDQSFDGTVAADYEDDEEENGKEEFVGAQRSSTPKNGPTTTNSSAIAGQGHEFSIHSGNLSEISGDFELLQLGYNENVGINVDFKGTQPLDADEQYLRAFRRQIAAHSGNDGNVVAVPRANALQTQKPPVQNAQQTLTFSNNNEQMEKEIECMASIELCLFQGIHRASLNIDNENLYMDKHLINWKIGGGNLAPLLCQKVEEIVRADQMLRRIAIPNFGGLDKRAWAKFFPAGQNQFGGQQFRVDYGGEQMKSETEYFVHLYLGLSSSRQQRGQDRQQNLSTDEEDSQEESHFNVDNDGHFPITIMDLHGRIHRLYRLNAKTKISELKMKIFEKIGIPMEQQRLIHFGKPIDNELDKELGVFKIGKNSTIHVVMRLNAGHFHG